MERTDDLEPEEQHVAETSAEELAAEDELTALEEEEPEAAGQVRDDLPGLGRNTSQDIGGGGGGSTADPGRQDPIVPGEGRL